MNLTEIKDILKEIEEYAIKRPEPPNVHSASEDCAKAIAYHALAGTVFAEAQKLNALEESNTFKTERKSFDSNADWTAHKKAKLSETKYCMTQAENLVSNLKLRVDFLRTYISYEKQQIRQGV